MADYDQYELSYDVPAAEAVPADRSKFIRMTYLHLAGAVALSALLIAGALLSPIGPVLAKALFGNGRIGWIVVIGLFMVTNWGGSAMAHNRTNVGLQYLGLGVVCLAWSIMLSALMLLAVMLTGGTDILLQSLIITFLAFGGLTGFVMFTGYDFSFIGGFLAAATMVALGVIVLSMIIGFSLGLIFIAAMLLLCCGYILYDTSQVMHRYPVDMHVGAACALYSDLAMTLWYVINLLLSLRR